MSAHSAAHRRSWLSALVAQVSEFVFEEVEEPAEPQPIELEPRPVIAVAAAAPNCGASTVARLVAAELAVRTNGAAVVSSPTTSRRTAPPARAAIRLAGALAGAAEASACGRLCVVAAGAGAPRGPRTEPQWDRLVAAARYLAPVVLDLPPDGSAAAVASVADRVVVVAPASGEPALLQAVAGMIGGDPVRVVNRVVEPGAWDGRADLQLPDSRIAARAAALGTRALGPLGSAISALVDALEVR